MTGNKKPVADEPKKPEPELDMLGIFAKRMRELQERFEKGVVSPSIVLNGLQRLIQGGMHPIDLFVWARFTPAGEKIFNQWLQNCDPFARSSFVPEYRGEWTGITLFEFMAAFGPHFRKRTDDDLFVNRVVSFIEPVPHPNTRW